GRDTRPFEVGDRHLVTGNPLETDGPEGFGIAIFGLGCFWGEEKTFWEQPGVWSTSVGYAGGHTPHPTYEQVCTGRTGHAEGVRGEAERLGGRPGGASPAVRAAAGDPPRPTYEELCTGRPGHAEVVRVIFDPSVTSYADLLKVFWENHDPTQGMRQGNDRGS